MKNVHLKFMKPKTLLVVRPKSITKYEFNNDFKQIKSGTSRTQNLLLILSFVLLFADGGPGGVKKLHRCSVCGKSYPRPSRLREHFKIHATEKLHRCSVCAKAFTTTTNLRAHEKIHMANKPHPCSICPKSFLRPCLLRKHMRIHVRDGLIADPADKVRPES